MGDLLVFIATAAVSLTIGVVIGIEAGADMYHRRLRRTMRKIKPADQPVPPISAEAMRQLTEAYQATED